MTVGICILVLISLYWLISLRHLLTFLEGLGVEAITLIIAIIGVALVVIGRIVEVERQYGTGERKD
jgi:small-conductance mechanosensitive channel